MTSLPTENGPAPPKPPRDALDGLWAGIAIAAIWIAVLGIGLWGGDFTSANGGAPGQFTRFPVVAIVAPCALLATIAVARRARR